MRKFRPQFEDLESREVPSVCTWTRPDTSPGVGDSTVSTNWLNGNVPGAYDDVVIDDNTSSIQIRQTQLRSITTPYQWAGAIYLDNDNNNNFILGNGDYSVSRISCYLYLNEGMVCLAGDEVTFEQAAICKDPITTGSKKLYLEGNTFFQNGVAIQTPVDNIGTWSVSRNVSWFWSGAYVDNYGTFTVGTGDGTGTWATTSSDPTLNIFNNYQGGVFNKVGEGSYSFGSYVHSESQFDVWLGSLSLSGRATASFGYASIHQLGNLITIHYDADLTAANAVWVESGTIQTMPGWSDNPVASRTGDLRVTNGGVIYPGGGMCSGLSVLVVCGEVRMLTDSAFIAEFNTFLGSGDKMICGTLFMDDSIVFSTYSNYLMDSFADFKMIDTVTGLTGNAFQTYILIGFDYYWDVSEDFYLKYIPLP